MVAWHYHFNRHEFEQARGVDDGHEVLRAMVHRVIKSWTQLSLTIHLTELKFKK